MVIWGAIWGAVLGALWSGYGNSEFRLIFGAILGALAGWTLRSAVRKEVARAQASRPTAPAAAGTMMARFWCHGSAMFNVASVGFE